MKIFTGVVLHTKSAKTATVEVERTVSHPVYGKRQRRIKKYHVHDEIGVKPGDTVKFVACRPVSKLKRWKILEVEGDKKKKDDKKQTKKKGTKK